MKNLIPYSIFESDEYSNGDLNDIKDIFQDIIDDYDIERLDQLSVVGDNDGIYYQLYDIKASYSTHPESSYIVFRIFFNVSFAEYVYSVDKSDSVNKLSTMVDKFREDSVTIKWMIEDRLPRLRSIGYDARVRDLTKLVTGYEVTIVRIKD